VRETKNNVPQLVFLGREIRDHLVEFKRGRGSGPLFQGREGKPLSARHVHRRLGEWLKKAGVTRSASPHSLRHHFAMRLYKRTGDILLVKEALHHRSLASTLVYARADEERLRRALA